MKRINKIYVDGENYEIYDKSAHEKIDGLEIPEIDTSSLVTKEEVNAETKVFDICITSDVFFNKFNNTNYIQSAEFVGNWKASGLNNLFNYINTEWNGISKIKVRLSKYSSPATYDSDCIAIFTDKDWNGSHFYFTYINHFDAYNHPVIVSGNTSNAGNDYYISFRAIEKLYTNFYTKPQIDTKLNALEIPDTSNFATSTQLTELSNRVDSIEDSAIDSALLEGLQNDINTNSTNISTLSSSFMSYKNGFDANIQDLQAITTQNSQKIANKPDFQVVRNGDYFEQQNNTIYFVYDEENGGGGDNPSDQSTISLPYITINFAENDSNIKVYPYYNEEERDGDYINFVTGGYNMGTLNNASGFNRFVINNRDYYVEFDDNGNPETEVFMKGQDEDGNWNYYRADNIPSGYKNTWIVPISGYDINQDYGHETNNDSARTDSNWDGYRAHNCLIVQSNSAFVNLRIYTYSGETKNTIINEQLTPTNNQIKDGVYYHPIQLA